MIPVNEPLIAKNAEKYVLDCLKTGWISSAGAYIEKFEKDFARFLGVKYAVTTTSGTTALHLALLTLGIGPGDEVIVPALTMIASISAICYVGAKPVLVDSEPETGNLNPDKIEEKITKRTRVIMPVHLYGHPADMDPIMRIAKKYKLDVLEDAAEVHGAEYQGKKAGSFGKINCFSFYANKIVTTGEGGMVVTDNKQLADKARSLKDLAHSKKRRFLHDELGYNFRMTNIQAALGLAQLEEIERFIKIKRGMAKLYGQLLKDVQGIRLPVEKKGVKNVYWMYAVLIDPKGYGLNRDKLMIELGKRGIGSRSYFIPAHKQPFLKKRGLFKDERYPVAEELSMKGMYLPSGLAITESQIRTVVKTIKEIKKKNE
jgi:perosamine synthetase